MCMVSVLNLCRRFKPVESCNNGNKTTPVGLDISVVSSCCILLYYHLYLNFPFFFTHQVFFFWSCFLFLSFPVKKKKKIT